MASFQEKIYSVRKSRKNHRRAKESKFSNRVYQVVKKIPQGKVMSYKEVAQKACFSRAWRAVGNILAKNKNPQIPCHRVIKSDRGIGRYNRGAKRKIYLLQKEGIQINSYGKITH